MEGLIFRDPGNQLTETFLKRETYRRSDGLLAGDRTPRLLHRLAHRQDNIGPGVAKGTVEIKYNQTYHPPFQNNRREYTLFLTKLVIFMDKATVAERLEILVTGPVVGFVMLPGR